MNGWVLAGTTFLASAVEAVEALTIVMAVGFTRSWRPALTGTAWALLALLAIVALLGPAIVVFVPLAVIRLVIGIFLTLFGLAWLRKAILRFSGRKALHDEAAIFEKERAALASESRADALRADRIAFATAFNAVLLEGLEVAVIVVTFSAAYGVPGLRWSGLGAAAAVILVCAAGVALRSPLRQVPENAMKFVVGIMLTSFGTFWSGEGLGIAWWHADLSLLWIVAAFLLASGVAIAISRRPAPAPQPRKTV